MFQNTGQLLECSIHVLKELIRATSHLQPAKTIFNSSGLVNASIQTYLARIFKFTNCSNSCFVVAFILLDRLQLCDPSLTINSKNVFKLVATAILISVKTYDDQFYKQSFYARVAGLKVQELNRLELYFLNALNFETTISLTLFQKYVEKLQDVSQDLQQRRRGGSRQADSYSQQNSEGQPGLSC